MKRRSMIAMGVPDAEMSDLQVMSIDCPVVPHPSRMSRSETWRWIRQTPQATALLAFRKGVERTEDSLPKIHQFSLAKGECVVCRARFDVH